MTRIFQILLQPRHFRHLGLDLCPCGCQLRRLVFKRGQFGGDGIQPLAGTFCAFFLQGGLLDLQLDNGTIRLVQISRLAVRLDAQMASSLVHHINRLVGQKALGNIAVGQPCRGDQRVIGNADTMMQLVFFLQAAQHENSVLDRRLINKDRLKTPRQGGILFHILPVFIQRCRPDTAQLAARKGRFQKVRCIHRPVRLAGPDQLVHLIDKQHHLTITGFDFFQYGFQAFLKLAAIFRAGDKRPHIQRQQRFVGKRLRHVAIHNPLRQPLGNSCLANARLANQDRVVLCPAGQNLDGAADLGLAANHRVQLATPGRVGQVCGEFCQRLITVFGSVAVGGAPLAHVRNGGSQTAAVKPGPCQDTADLAFALDHRQKQGVNREETVIQIA